MELEKGTDDDFEVELVVGCGTIRQLKRHDELTALAIQQLTECGLATRLFDYWADWGCPPSPPPPTSQGDRCHCGEMALGPNSTCRCHDSLLVLYPPSTSPSKVAPFFGVRYLGTKSTFWQTGSTKTRCANSIKGRISGSLVVFC